jgi:hypothetical protein
VVARLRAQWPEVRIVLRADSGFCREGLLLWCVSFRQACMKSTADNC